MTLERERERQQALLRTLWRDEAADALRGWLATPPERFERGLLAYTANAGAAAERALGAAFPTVAQLVGEDSFGALARAFWQARPPLRGDLAQWGAELPAFIADSEQLAAEPYLADVARLDWAVHLAEGAPDVPATPQGLQHLAEADPSALQLRLRPGSALLASAFPVATIWQAHRSHAAGRFEPVRAALAAGHGEQALVWRAGWRAAVCTLSDADAAFTAALLAGRSLGAALEAASGFDFAAWLTVALQQGWLAGVAVAET